MVVLRLARDNNVPVDVSVASGLLLDELVSFCFAVVFCTHMAPRRWGSFHGRLAPRTRPQRPRRRLCSSRSAAGRNGELLVCRVLHLHHSVQIGAHSMVVLGLAGDHNVPVDVSVALGLLLDETVSF